MGRHRYVIGNLPGRRTVAAATSMAVLVIIWAAWDLTNDPASPPEPVTAAPSGEAVAEVGTATVEPEPAWNPPPIVPIPPTPRPGPEPPGTPSPPAPPSPTPEGTGRPSPSPAPAPDITAAYSTSEVWDSGFQTSISLENTSSRSQLATLVLVLPGGVGLGDPPECWWDVTCEQTGRTITLVTTSPLDPGTRRFIGFNATRNPGSAPFEPQECTINGSPCDGF